MIRRSMSLLNYAAIVVRVDGSGGRLRTIPNLVQNDDAESLENTHARVQFEHDRWFQKLREVVRDLQLETVQSFYKAMYDETTMEIRYCVVCALQKASIDLGNYIREDFLPPYLLTGTTSFTSHRTGSLRMCTIFLEIMGTFLSVMVARMLYNGK